MTMSDLGRRVSPPAQRRAGPSPTRPAARTVPALEQVRPGLWSLPVPLPVARPAYTIVHVLESPAGPYLIDAGWDDDGTFEALCAGLVAIGTSVAEVRGVIVTHAHPDHHGLAGRVRAASGAWMSLHPLDAALLDRMEQGSADRLAATLARAGVPADVTEALPGAGQLALRDLARPDVLLEDGARPDVPGWDLRALWTPGHSPGHLCFWEPVNRLLLSGDHVLPVTAVGTPPPSEDNPDPLGDHLRSLARLRELDVAEVLPAHEHRFTALEHRLADLDALHGGRLAELVAGLRAGASTPWELAAWVSWRRPLCKLTGVALRTAVFDTLAYLASLGATGVAQVDAGRPDRWRLADPR
ncbi:Zn-dependent hydrolase, glyoxylase [Frankia sp. AgKG'84/4]